ncbi:MAG: ATP-dependent sacrificial sulfur transferase LarE [Desulfobulbus sp.]
MALTQRQKTQYDRLLADLSAMERAVVAFSGGVDSVLLLYAAHQALCEAVLAVTFATPYTPCAEINAARALAEAMHVRHRVIELPILDTIKQNPPERCYLCKRALFGVLTRIAKEEGIEFMLDGSNVDDLADYRPGHRAIMEFGVHSPLLDAELTKQDIRDLSREHGLSTWDKPAGACLLTRIPHDTAVEADELDRIDKGETFLRLLGFSTVRLRSHGTLARIELPPESIDACLDHLLRDRIDTHLKELGYRHIAVDLAGYRMGSLNLPMAGTCPKEDSHDQ